jgi:hypothetical protein
MGARYTHLPVLQVRSAKHAGRSHKSGTWVQDIPIYLSCESDLQNAQVGVIRRVDGCTLHSLTRLVSPICQTRRSES